MFLGLECTLEKALNTAEEMVRRYSELLATSIGTQNHSQNTPPNSAAWRRSTPNSWANSQCGWPKYILPRGQKTNKRGRWPKSIKTGVSKLKNLWNNAVLVECKSNCDREILEKELSKLYSHRTTPKNEAPDPITYACA